MQDLLLDRLVWFLRNVDLTQGLAGDRRALPRRHRGGRRARSTRRCRRTRRRRATARVDELIARGRAGGAGAADRQSAGADGRARHRAGRRPRGKKPIAEVAATYFAAEALSSGSTASPRRRASIAVVGLFRPAGARPRARFDRRRRAPPHRGDGGDRRGRRRRRSRPGSSRARPRSSASARRSTRSPAVGLTLSKLSVAASLLGDLARDGDGYPSPNGEGRREAPGGALAATSPPGSLIARRRLPLRGEG